MIELNCIVIDDESYAIEDLAEMIASTPGINLCRGFNNATDAITYVQKEGAVDIIFCDISMPDINGIEAGKILNVYCSFLIYITAHRHYTEDAFGVFASGYMLKPVKQIRFIEEINRLIAKKKRILELEKHHEIIFIKGNHKNSFHKIWLNDIIFIESLANYVNIHTTKGTKITYIGLKRVEAKISNANKFIRISKTKIISLNYLLDIDGNTANLANNHCFLIGKGYREALLSFVNSRLIN